MKIVYFGVGYCNPMASKNGAEIFQYNMAEKTSFLGNSVKLVSMPRKKYFKSPQNTHFESIEYPSACKRFFLSDVLKKC